MPFGVRRYPGSYDPRGGTFCIEGFAWGGVPAIVYRLSTVGAFGGYEFLNGDGITLALSSDVIGDRIWHHAATMSIPFDVWFEILGQETPPLGPGSNTVEWRINMTTTGETVYAGNTHADHPDAINGWPVVPCFPADIEPNRTPNPIVVTPCIWDTPITP